MALAAAGAGQPPADAGAARLVDCHRFEIVEVLVDHGFELGSVSALSESTLQERVRFSRDLQCQAGAGQLRLEPLVGAPQLVELDLFGWSLRLGRGRQGLAGTGVACLAPLGDVRGVQALPAQQRSPLIRTRRERVVLFEDPTPPQRSAC